MGESVGAERRVESGADGVGGAEDIKKGLVGSRYDCIQPAMLSMLNVGRTGAVERKLGPVLRRIGEKLGDDGAIVFLPFVPKGRR
jgi:hypothetical protein